MTSLVELSQKIVEAEEVCAEASSSLRIAQGAWAEMNRPRATGETRPTEEERSLCERRLAEASRAQWRANTERTLLQVRYRDEVAAMHRQQDLRRHHAPSLTPRRLSSWRRLLRFQTFTFFRRQETPSGGTPQTA